MTTTTNVHLIDKYHQKKTYKRQATVLLFLYTMCSNILYALNYSTIFKSDRFGEWNLVPKKLTTHEIK